MRPAFPLAIAAFAVFFGTPQSVSSQQNADPSVTEIVNRAAAQRPLYQEVFRNLLSRETKTFEIYGKNGEVKRTRTVVSTFLVYQLSRDPTRISEFRNIQSVDGKPVENTEGRTENLFATVAKAESSEKELKQIETESQRFDEDISISGQTLFQAVTLTENLSPFFEFTLEGKENIDGETAFVVAYRQIRATPYITADPTRMPADHRLTVFNDAGLKVGMELGERLSGKLWIDTNSFRIRRELRDFTIQPRNASRPVMLAETTFQYQPSTFGILVPKQITHIQYNVTDGGRSSRKDAKITFTYDNFTKPDVEVKSAEIRTN